MISGSAISGSVVVLAVAVAGGLGAVLRYLLASALRSVSTRFPVGIAVVNVLGSFLLGLVVGATSAGLLPEPWPSVLGPGLLGGFTTFSTASADTLRLVGQRRLGAALGNALGVLVISVGAAAVGMAIGSSLSP